MTINDNVTVWTFHLIEKVLFLSCKILCSHNWLIWSLIYLSFDDYDDDNHNNQHQIPRMGSFVFIYKHDLFMVFSKSIFSPRLGSVNDWPRRVSLTNFKWHKLLINPLCISGEYIGDATPALFIVILLFMIPAKPLQWYKSPPLLDWQTIQEKFPWNIFILIGGGFVLAKGTQANNWLISDLIQFLTAFFSILQTSGLSEWFSETLIKMHLLPPIVLMLILCIIALCITELTSNTATATVLLPSIIDMVRNCWHFLLHL